MELSEFINRIVYIDIENEMTMNTIRSVPIYINKYNKNTGDVEICRLDNSDYIFSSCKVRCKVNKILTYLNINGINYTILSHNSLENRTRSEYDIEFIKNNCRYISNRTNISDLKEGDEVAYCDFNEETGIFVFNPERYVIEEMNMSNLYCKFKLRNYFYGFLKCKSLKLDTSMSDLKYSNGGSYYSYIIKLEKYGEVR